MCPDWIAFHVADRRPEMLIVERTRKWSRLPKVTGKYVPHVELLRINAMAAMEGLPKRVFAFRYGHKMHVIRHEAVSANPQVKPPTAFVQEFDITPAVRIITEDVQSSDTPLGDMQGNSGQHNSSDPRHGV
jgi:hypothetical protein